MQNNLSRIIATDDETIEELESIEENESIATSGKTGKVNLSIDLPQNDFVLCMMCGHKNKTGTGLCEMCSNYLFI